MDELLARLPDDDPMYEVCPYCYNRCAKSLWRMNAGRCEHCQSVSNADSACPSQEKS